MHLTRPLALVEFLSQSRQQDVGTVPLHRSPKSERLLGLGPNPGPNLGQILPAAELDIVRPHSTARCGRPPIVRFYPAVTALKFIRAECLI